MATPIKPTGPYTRNLLAPKTAYLTGAWGFGEGSGNLIDNVGTSLDDLEIQEGTTYVTATSGYKWITTNEGTALRINYPAKRDQYLRMLNIGLPRMTRGTLRFRFRWLTRSVIQQLICTYIGHLSTATSTNALSIFFRATNGLRTTQNGKFLGATANQVSSPNNLPNEYMADVIQTWSPENGLVMWYNFQKVIENDTNGDYVPNEPANPLLFYSRVQPSVQVLNLFRGDISFISIYSEPLTSADIRWLEIYPYLSIAPILYASYPIETRLGEADETIVDYRATRLNNRSSLDAVQTVWNITGNGEDFTIRTGNNPTDTPGVLDSSLTHLDIWLPPDTEYQIRMRQDTTGNGNYTEWTPFHTFTSLGYINSYDKYQILCRRGVTL